MPNLCDKDKCCGCFSCFNACPKSAISMQPDVSGFLYPSIDTSKCIGCTLCEKACPSINYQAKEIKVTPSYYVGAAKNETIRRESTSGGVFSALAITIINRNGIVVGATYENGVCCHKIANSIDELKKFRSSKYVQSDVGTIFKEIKGFLQKGDPVLFSGTPCQVVALNCFLGRSYDNLITVDVMCRAVPSPKILKKYNEFLKIKFDSIDSIVFRDKSLGYSYSTMGIYGNYKGKKKTEHLGKESNEYLRLFFEGYSTRKSCATCIYQDKQRVSDITLWDCYRVYTLAPKFDDNKGATNILVWTQKGADLLRDSSSEVDIIAKEFSNDLKPLARQSIPYIEAPNFYTDAEVMSPKEFFNKYSPNTVRIKIKSRFRRILHCLGIHDLIRKMVHRLRDR